MLLGSVAHEIGDPLEPEYPVLAAWRRSVVRELEAKGWARAELARRVGCSRAGITNLLSGDIKRSSLVPKINKAFGWAAPAEIATSPDTGADAIEARFARMTKELPPQLRDSVVKGIFDQLRVIIEAAAPTQKNK